MIEIFMTEHVKYPRTFHLPWSPGATSDDKRHSSTSQWYGREVVITKKMDGENTTMYRDGIHARSLDYSPHWSRDLVKAIHAQIAHEIPEGMRLCGENMTALHSIPYTNLDDWFLIHSMWENSTCLSWNETVEWCTLLGIARDGAPLYTVPLLYWGEYSDDLCQELCRQLDLEKDEGLVVRPAGRFDIDEFPLLVGKYVRASHVKTDQHWNTTQERNHVASSDEA